MGPLHGASDRAQHGQPGLGFESLPRPGLQRHRRAPGGATNRCCRRPSRHAIARTNASTYPRAHAGPDPTADTDTDTQANRAAPDAVAPHPVAPNPIPADPIASASDQSAAVEQCLAEPVAEECTWSHSLTDVIPAAMPGPSEGGPTPSATATADPSAGSGAAGGPGSPASGGSGSGGSAGPGGDPESRLPSIRFDERRLDLGGASVGLFAGVEIWAVPAATIALPGLLVLIWVALQAAGAIAWIPAVRRLKGKDDPRRRPMVRTR